MNEPWREELTDEVQAFMLDAFAGSPHLSTVKFFCENGNQATRLDELWPRDWVHYPHRELNRVLYEKDSGWCLTVVKRVRRGISPRANVLKFRWNLETCEIGDYLERLVKERGLE